MIIEPLLSKIKDELKKEIAIYKIDTEKNPDRKKFFGVYYLPTVITIKNARIVSTFHGVISKKVIRDALHQLIEKSGNQQ